MSIEYCVSVFVSPLLKHHLPNLRSLLQRSVRFSRLSVKGCNQSGMLCVGSPLSVSSRKKVYAGSRFPVACLSASVSIGFLHACLSLRVVTGSDNVTHLLEPLDLSVDLDVEDKLLLEYDDSPGTTRGTKLSIVCK